MAGNLDLNKVTNVITQHGAVSNYSGRAVLHTSSASNLHAVSPELYDGRTREIAGQVEVDAFDAAGLVELHHPVDFIRMDVEGHEVEILDSLASCAERGPSCGRILMEVHRPSYHPDHHDIVSPLERLFRSGYRPELMSSTREDRSRFRGARLDTGRSRWDR